MMFESQIVSDRWGAAVEKFDNAKDPAPNRMPKLNYAQHISNSV